MTTDTPLRPANRMAQELAESSGFLLARLGVAPLGGRPDRDLAGLLIAALATRTASIDRVFFDWRGGRDPGAERYPAAPFRALAAALEPRRAAAFHPYWADPDPCSMHIDEVEAIWSRIDEADDWAPFNAKIEAIRRMGAAMAGA